ncbi:putative Axonemal dynein light chain [Fasciolopsis buskii]|uniref:Putative Axonemal dynein light chain n=1 Tax=Fasciolopsis buskii TaxID=27845 RepID=A0A8E0RNS1_9TREM|nr:putative Axonemal dynein light chain [Fasciolopsis buski]
MLKERLTNEQYSAEKTHGRFSGLQPNRSTEQCTALADDIKHLMKKNFPLSRYRYLVQVVMGEQRGQGVKVAYRCYWDPDADNYAEATFMNDSLFCVAAAFGVYSY